MFSLRSTSVLITLCLAQSAHAATVAVAPPINNGADAKQVMGVHQLIASELDFMSSIDGVTDLEKKPSSLTNNCLNSTSCLGTITKAAGTDWLVTGAVKPEGSNLSIDLVLYDKGANKIVRRKAWTVPGDPSGMADAMTPILNELLSGNDPNSASATAVAAADFSGDDDGDDFAFEEDEYDEEVDGLLAIDDFSEEDERRKQAAAAQQAAIAAAAAQQATQAAAQQAAQVAAQQAAAQQAAAQQAAAQQAAADEAARQAAAQEQARQAAAQEQARQAAAQDAERQAAADRAAQLAAVQAAADLAAAQAAVAQAAAAQAAAAAVEEDDASMISFGGSAEDISAEDIDAMIQFGAPSPAPAPAPAPATVATQSATQFAQQNTAPAPRNNRPSASSSTAATDLGERVKEIKDRPESGPQHASVSVRGGYARYFEFDFITAGGELGLHIPNTGVVAIVGLEGFAVQRTLPPEIQVQERKIYEWNVIYPVNLGLIYKLDMGVVHPYFGADAVMVQYYRDEVGSDWAGGARARLGADFMLNSNFGFNANAAIGAWSGANWPLIEPGVGAAGLLPQFNAGAVAVF